MHSRWRYCATAEFQKSWGYTVTAIRAHLIRSGHEVGKAEQDIRKQSLADAAQTSLLWTRPAIHEGEEQALPLTRTEQGDDTHTYQHSSLYKTDFHMQDQF